jgi:hypothetical protein
MADAKNQKYFLDISPNPTYSFARVKLLYGAKTSSGVTQYFTGDQVRQTFPKVTIDLYYGNEKVQTLNFTDVGNEVDISERYLQRVGTYRIIADFLQDGNPQSASFEVKRR